MKRIRLHMDKYNSTSLNLIFHNTEYEILHDYKNAEIVIFNRIQCPVNPVLYNEPVNLLSTFKKNADDMENEYRSVKLFEQCVKDKKTMVGFGYNAHFLCVMAGGSLIQHVNGHIGDHIIRFKDDKDEDDYVVFSNHDQMMYPYDLDKKDFDVLAYTPFKLSNVYLNGDTKNHVFNNIDEVEPEIIHFKNHNVFCIEYEKKFNSAYSETEDVTLAVLNPLIKNTINKK